jgi:hypothetical protein
MPVVYLYLDRFRTWLSDEKIVRPLEDATESHSTNIRQPTSP